MHITNAMSLGVIKSRNYIPLLFVNSCLISLSECIFLTYFTRNMYNSSFLFSPSKSWTPFLSLSGFAFFQSLSSVLLIKNIIVYRITRSRSSTRPKLIARKQYVSSFRMFQFSSIPTANPYWNTTSVFLFARAFWRYSVPCCSTSSSKVMHCRPVW